MAEQAVQLVKDAMSDLGLGFSGWPDPTTIVRWTNRMYEELQANVGYFNRIDTVTFAANTNSATLTAAMPNLKDLVKLKDVWVGEYPQQIATERYLRTKRQIVSAAASADSTPIRPFAVIQTVDGDGRTTFALHCEPAFSAEQAVRVEWEGPLPTITGVDQEVLVPSEVAIAWYRMRGASAKKPERFELEQMEYKAACANLDRRMVVVKAQEQFPELEGYHSDRAYEFDKGF